MGIGRKLELGFFGHFFRAKAFARQRKYPQLCACTLKTTVRYNLKFQIKTGRKNRSALEKARYGSQVRKKPRSCLRLEWPVFLNRPVWW